MAELVNIPTRFGAYVREQGKQNPSERLNAEQIARKMGGVKSNSIRRIMKDQAVPSWDPENEFVTKLASAIGVPVDKLTKLQLEAIEERKKVLAERNAKFKKGKDPSLNETTVAVAQALGAVKENFEPEPIDASVIKKIKNSGVVDNKEQLAQVMLAMMSDLKKKDAVGSHVLLTFQGAKGVFGTDQAEREWTGALNLAVENGVNIDYLVRLDRDPERTRKIVSNIMQFWGKPGQFRAFAFSQEGTLSIPEGALIVTKITEDGGVEAKEALFAIKKDGAIKETGNSISVDTMYEDIACVDAAVYMSKEKHKDSQWMTYLYQHFNLRKERETTEIFVSETTTNIIPVLSAIDKSVIESSVKTRGDSLIFSKRITDFPRPMDHYSLNGDWAKTLKRRFKEIHGRSPSIEEFSNEVELRLERFYFNLRSQVQNKTRREIYFKVDLEEFIEKGIPEPYGINPNPRILKQRLAEMCSLIKKFPNYHVALLDKSKDKLDHDIYTFLRDVKPVFLEVKTGARVAVEFPGIDESQDNSQKQARWLLATHPLVVEALEDMMENFWNAIDDEDKDKFSVLTWLEQQMDFLDKM